MTTNSFQVNQSAVVAGLGTSTCNIVTAGNYNLSFKSFLPYTPGGSAVASQPSNEITNITFAADTTGNKNSTYFTFGSAEDNHLYYVWFNINSAGVDPAVSGRTGIAVAGATNASAATLATAAITAINASDAALYLTASAGASGHVILTTLQYGDETNAANGTASPGFSYSVTQAGSGGSGSELEVQIKQNSTVLATYGVPTPSQPIMGGGVEIQAAANDVITVILSSLSIVDNLPNAVKTIINLFQGV